MQIRVRLAKTLEKFHEFVSGSVEGRSKLRQLETPV